MQYDQILIYMMLIVSMIVITKSKELRPAGEVKERFLGRWDFSRPLKDGKVLGT